MRTATMTGKQFVMISIEELQTVISTEVEKVISRAFRKAKEDEHPEYYSSKEAMKRLKCKETTLHRYIKYDFLHPVKTGRKNMFPVSEVDGLIGRKIHLPQ